jgi:cytidylate kinase
MGDDAKTKKWIIAIDGPSGAGKSTVAKLLAKGLGYVVLDTGAMYRAVAFRAKQRGICLEDEERLSQLASSLQVTFLTRNGELRVLCDGEDVTESIRSPEMSSLASDISKKEGVRGALVRLQREMGRAGGVILEGRDIGTVVFPDADAKFYLDADAEERARRRYEELARKGVKVNFQETLEDVIRRDRNDMTRAISPLRKAKDAVVIDSTHLSVEEVVERMIQVIQQKRN